MRIATFAFFFVSGVCGLAYEVVWVRAASTVLGNTTHAIGTVVGVFMGGLALGAWLGGRRADGTARPLALYAALEAGVSLSALAMPFLLHPWLIGGPIAVRVLLVAALILVPTTLMGATLPLLTRFLSATADQGPAEAGRAYAINSFGGVLGTLCAGFLLIPALGLRGTTFVAVGLNAAIAIGALALSRRTSPCEISGESARPARLALAVACVSGFASLVYEVSWTRALVLSLGSTVYAFTLILAAFIFGIASGSAFCASRATRTTNPLFFLGTVQGLAALAALVLGHYLGELPLQMGEIVGSLNQNYDALLLVQFLLLLLFVGVPTFLLGATFPLACRIALGDARSVGRSVGAVYAWNTIGSIAGTIAATFLLIPAIGLQGSITFAAGLNLAVATALYFKHAPRRWPAAIPAAVLVGSLLLPAWDTAVVSSGPYLYLRRSGDMTIDALRASVKAESTPLASYHDSYGLVTVHRERDKSLSIRVNGKADASSGPDDMITQRLLGHIPMLHAAETRNVFILGLGAGVTLSAAAAYPVVRIDMVEISGAMIRAAGHFAEINRNVLHDPRVNVITGDGRHALAARGLAYDAIISEPSNLWVSGMATLFTREFFESARARLAPGGVMCQWIHAYRLSTDDFRSLLRTFYAVFPHGSVWEVFPGSDYILLGHADGAFVPFDRVVKRCNIKQVAADLKECGIDAPSVLARHLALDRDGALAFAGDGPLLTDDHNRVEYTAPRSLHMDARAATIAAIDPLRRTPLERRVYDALPEEARRARSARADVAMAVHAQVEGEVAVAIQKFAAVRNEGRLEPQAARQYGELLTEVNEFAQRFKAEGRYEQAIEAFQAIHETSHAYGLACYEIGLCYRQLSRPKEAKDYFDRALALNPKHQLSIVGLAKLHESQGDWAGAVAFWRRATEDQPDNVALLINLAAAYEKLGLKEEARVTARRAREIFKGADPVLDSLVDRLGP